VNFRDLLKARIQRGFHIHSIGPNEARFIFDFTLALGTMLFVYVYAWAFTSWPLAPLLGVMPLLLVGLNILLGIYTSKRTATGKQKAARLVFALALSCVGAIWLNPRATPLIILWSGLMFAPLILPRILLGLSHGRHRSLIRSVSKDKGPTLLVGGAGYIGTHVIERLLEDRRAVRVLDRLMYGLDPVRPFLGHPNFELITGDATDIAKLTQAMRDVSAVVHLAGLVGDPACAVDESFTRQTNIISTRMIKDVAQAMGVYRLVFASSCSVYGVSNEEVQEGDPLRPVSLYAKTKVDSEQELLASCKDDFFVTILRFATVFGHSRRPRFDLVANLFTGQGMQEGLIRIIGPSQWRPFIHVRDLSYAILAVLKANPSIVQAQIFNVGHKSLNMTIGELGKRVSAMVALDRAVKTIVEENASDRRNYAVSFDKITKMLGYEARESLESGVQEMIDHFQKKTYGDYRSPIYSNLAVTREAVQKFKDPEQRRYLYEPLAD